MGALSFPLLVLAALAGEPGDLLPGYSSGSGPWGTVRQKGWGPAERGKMTGEIAAALARVEGRIGRRRGRPFEAVLTPDPREFARVYRAVAGRRPEDWIAGAAFPDQDLLLVRGDVSPARLPAAERPAAVLEHELAHLVIHADPRASVPRWFDEGVAMWASGQRIDPDDEAILSGLARIGALHDLADLDRKIPPSHDLASIAYEESFLAVEWLVERFGPRVIGDLLDRLAESAPFPEALKARTGLSLAELQKEFRLWLRGKRSLWEVLLGGVSLWTVVALLALLAIGRAALRRRRLLRQMEARESEEDTNPYHTTTP